jgi:hypothetical protein
VIGWSKLHNEEFHNLYCSPSIIRITKSKEVGKPVGRPRCRWENNIKMDLREMGWIDLAQDRNQWRALVNMVVNLQVP